MHMTSQPAIGRRSLATLVFVVALTSFACASTLLPEENLAGRGEARAMANRGSVAEAEPGNHFLSRGAELQAEGRDGEAMAQFISAYIETRRGIEARTAIAWLQLRHDHSVAEAMFTGIIDEDPGQAVYWYGLGVARLLGEDFEGAFEALQRSLDLGPDNMEASLAMSSVEVARGDLDSAVEFALRATELDEHSIEAANALGYTLMLRGDLVEAEAYLKRAANGAPGNITFTNNLGTCLALDGRHSEAFAVFAKAGERQRAYNNIAMVLMNAGLQEQATLFLEQALLHGGNADRTVLENLRRVVTSASLD